MVKPDACSDRHSGRNLQHLVGGEFAPGIIALVTPDGSARQVADGVAFPNGMAVTPDNTTLIVAESYGKRLTAFDIVADGICLDAEGAVWYADVPNHQYNPLDT